MKTITLGIITYNGAKYIDNLLVQLAPFVDEIVVVDSLSTDDTIAIAAHYGAKIYELPFTGSFADLRNFALDQATSQYMLFMDCDEVLDDPEKLFAIDFENDIYSLPRKGFIDGEFQAQWYPDIQHRIIKTNSLVRYESALHEAPIGREDAIVLDIDIIHCKTRAEQNYNNVRFAEMSQ